MYVGSTSGVVAPCIAVAYAFLFEELGELPGLADVLKLRKELGDLK
jgi:hypothetical protein